MNGQLDIGELQPSRYFLIVAIVVGLLFSFIAPDDNELNNPLVHTLQWQLQTVIPMFMAVGIHALLSRVGILKQLGAWSKLVVSGSLAALLFTPIALIIDAYVGGHTATAQTDESFQHELVAVGPPIVVCWLAINLPFQLGYRLTAQDIKSTTQSTGPFGHKITSGFIDLIQVDLRDDIVFLKSELHYLQVVTVKGKTLVLYSLKNAINELEQYDGLQPHRSYWVNRQFIESIQRTGREGKIILKDGTEIPVSRTRMKELHREADN